MRRQRHLVTLFSSYPAVVPTSQPLHCGNITTMARALLLGSPAVVIHWTMMTSNRNNHENNNNNNNNSSGTTRPNRDRKKEITTTTIARHINRSSSLDKRFEKPTHCGPLEVHSIMLDDIYHFGWFQVYYFQVFDGIQIQPTTTTTSSFRHRHRLVLIVYCSSFTINWRTR